MTIKISGKTMLLVTAGVGMLVTVYFTAKNTPEAQRRKEISLEEKKSATGDENTKLTFMESAKAQVGAYAPAIVSGVATIGTMIGSEVINEKNLNESKKKYDEFKKQVDKIDGKGSAKFIEKSVEEKKKDEKKGKPWDEEERFRIVFQGHSVQFDATREDVLTAIYELNRTFHINGIATFNEFLYYLGQPPVEEGNDRGWECYIGESVYGYTWIDIGLKECIDEPGVTEIYMPVYPHFFDEEECEDEIEEGCKKLGALEMQGTAVPTFLEEQAKKRIN